MSFAKAEISPNSVRTASGANTFTYSILPTITAVDTGVNEVEIVVPATFGLPTVTGVTVNSLTAAYTDNTGGTRTISIELTAKVTTNKVIEITFTSAAPDAEDTSGKDFTSAVDDTPNAPGAQDTTEGDGDSDPADNNSWNVKTWTINKTGVVNIVEGAILPGTSLNLQVKDADLDQNPGGSNDTTSVSVTTTKGDIANVTLSEISEAGMGANLLDIAQ